MTAPWRDLFDRVADGIQTEAEERELLEVLKTNAEARRQYRKFMEVHSALHWDSTCLAAPVAPAMQPADERPSTAQPAAWLPRVLTGISLLAVLAVGLAGIAFVGRQPDPLAVITKTRLLVPASDSPMLVAGRPLASGRLGIMSGAVELRLRNDVVLIFEGPGELDLTGELTAVLHDGTLFVKMPDGMQGFEVRTPTTDVLDLGTEFAVSVGAGSTTDVQVYDGAVIASTGSRQQQTRLPKRLTAGEAARFLPEAQSEPVPLTFSADRFLRELPAEVGIPLPLTGPGAGQERRYYGPAEHSRILVHRAPATMLIDGHLDEWAGDPGFTGTQTGAPGCPEWADGRMMYDENNLYIAARVGDPMPLRSVIDPDVDAGWGWRGGAVQVRVSTDRRMGWPAQGNGPSYYGQRRLEPTAAHRELAKNPRLRHLTMWFHAPTETPCLTINEGMLFADFQVNPTGFTGAFVKAADGKGYTMEYAIPWSLLGCADDPPQSGDVLAAVWQVLWGDDAGRLRREQMVEIRNPDEPLPINVWERAATWGRAEYQ
jgi:hypothetical protein